MHNLSSVLKLGGSDRPVHPRVTVSLAALITLQSLLVVNSVLCHADEPAEPNAGSAANVAKPAADDAAGIQFALTKVKPLLEARCYKCHGPADRRKEKELAGGLLVTSRKAMLAGGETGPAIVPEQPDKSLLLSAVRWDELEMPPDTKLPDGEIAILERWVRMGAPWPDDDHAVVAEAPKEEFPLDERRASHWAWSPLGDPAAPAVIDADWPRHALDRFVATAREQRKLGVAPDADRRTLIRRMTFALIGLPPTPEEIEAFVNDPAVDDEAVDRLADRLLASPHFGERWARHWLDLMRYAESRGHEFDYAAANAWHYRDYVIRALNADLPYNRYVEEHIAGDLLPEPRLHPERGFNESLLATGFWYLGDWVHSPTDIRADETDRIDNQLDVFGRAFLGLTIACARCHDHKFDAISTKDYYALAGYMQSSAYRQARFETMEHNRQIAQKVWDLRRATEERLREEVGSRLEAATKGAGNYLLAAAEVVRGGVDVPQATAQHKLDGKRLQTWVEYLKSASKDANHWLHGVADLAIQTDANFSTAWRGVLDGHEKARTAESDAWKSPKLVVDFAALPTGGWMQDGFTFGPGPVLPGDMIFAGSAAKPSMAVAQYGAARHDLAWPEMVARKGNESEPGALVRLKRSGRSLRTPTFTIDSGVNYLVRGKGMLVIVVASHRLIQGPLHGKLIGKFDTKDKLQWLRTDLKRYEGQRAHIEFVPAPGQPCEILQVTTGARPPLPQPNQVVKDLWLNEESKVASGADLCRAIERSLATAAERFTRGKIAENDKSVAHATLVAWMLEHSELLGLAKPVAEPSIRKLFVDLHVQQDELVSGVQRESRTAIAIWDGDSEDERLLIRGASRNPGDRVARRFLTALDGEGPTDEVAGSGRLALAHQVTDPQRNPLVTRVVVNRVWHHLLGRGIVPSVDNFGVLGQPPSHPELLDFLARQFVREGWSLKKLIREIVTSRTYRMSSRSSESVNDQLDPDNIYLHRMPIRRLEGEAIRDTILFVSGRLDAKAGGPPVPVYLTPFMTGRGRPSGGPLDGAGRRSVYISIRRNFLPPMMLAFDMPIPFNPVGRRNVSNVPAQALILMNDPFVIEQANVWARRVLGDTQLEPGERIGLMYQTAIGRPPTDAELAAGLDFLKEQASTHGLQGDAWQRDARVWADYGHVLWNAKEFIFVQ